MTAIVKSCDGSSFNCQIIGELLEENGVIVLRPKDLSEEDEGGEKIGVIAKLLGMKPQVLRSYYFLEVWDDR